MNFKSVRKLALLSAAFVGIGLAPMVVQAADNADVTVDINTASGITAVNVANMDFGHWLIGVHPGDTPAVVMAAANGALSTSGVGDSQLIELGAQAVGTKGEIRVTLPAGANGMTVQMTRGAIDDFDDTSISLSAVTYANSDSVGQTGTLLESTAVPITITTGATGALVSFGGTVTANDTPVGDGVTHTATFNVAFAY